MESFLQKLAIVITPNTNQYIQPDFHANIGEVREATGNSRNNL